MSIFLGILPGLLYNKSMDAAALTPAALTPAPRLEIIYLGFEDRAWTLTEDCTLDGARHIVDQIRAHGDSARLLVGGVWDVRPANYRNTAVRG